MSDIVERLRGIKVSRIRANLAVLGVTPIECANHTIGEAADTIEALRARVKELEGLGHWSARRFRQNDLEIYADYIDSKIAAQDEGQQP